MLIPARDESMVIETTILNILAQDYSQFEILVLNDHSSDGTGDIVRAIDDARVRVIDGKPLPNGWNGKNWACWQLSQIATGEILVFTDADVQWRPGALRALIAQLEHSQADLLTVWSTQISESWGERLVVPLMALVILGYLPAFAVYHLPFSVFAAANGQCMTFRRAAYEAIGGHQTVKNAIVEDIELARHIKAHGMKLDMADGAELIVCRMYNGWQQVRDGFAKNILAGYGNNLLFLVLATVFHWMVFLIPPLWLLFGWLNPSPDYPQTPLLLAILGIGVRALSAAVTRQRMFDALLLPVSVLLMTIIAAQAVYWRLRYGGVRWKGRTIKCAPMA
jgi:chlorobactene glucosyltransferase